MLIVLIAIYFVYSYFFNSSMNFYGKIMVYSAYCLQIISFIFTSLKNPGIPSLDTKMIKTNEERGLKLEQCHRCYLVCEALTSHHCPFCKVCFQGRKLKNK